MPHGQMHEAEWAEKVRHHKFMSNKRPGFQMVLELVRDD